MSRPIIPHVRLTLGKKEESAVLRVLRSGRIAAGPAVANLEKWLAAATGKKRGIAVSSGTAALHIALLALGVKRGDEVIFPSYVCQAPLNAVLYVGAVPKLSDINLQTFNIDPASVGKLISSRTKALIVPHMFGLMADLPALLKYRLPIIEDCAMAIGASFKGRAAGSFGDLATFSFYATKPFAGGEGGAVAASRASAINRALDFREYDKKGRFVVRYNYKMSDLHAAVALAQVKQLKSFNSRRRAIAARYDRALRGTGIITPEVPAGYGHAFSRYVIRVKDGSNLRAYLLRHGVLAGHGVVHGVHELWRADQNFPNTDLALATAVSLPIYPTLSMSEQEKIIQLLRNYKN